MAIKIQGSTIIDDNRQIVDVSTIFVDNVDPTTIGLTTSFSVNAQEASVLGVTFSDDGKRMFIIGNGGDNISQYSLSTAWDLDTASYLSGEDYNDRADSEPRGITWSWDGEYFYANDRQDVFQHQTVTPFSLTGATYTGKFYTYSAQTSNYGVQVQFKTDGTKMYVSESSGDRIYQYSLATPWDVSTGSYDSIFFDFTSDETALTGFAFNPTGKKLIITGNTGDKLIYYTLSTPWDLSTLSSGTDIATGLNNPYGIYWRKDGGKLYVANSSSDNIVEFTITQNNDGVRSFILGDTESYGGGKFYGENEFYGNVVLENNLKVTNISAGSSSIGFNTSNEAPNFILNLGAKNTNISKINPINVGFVTSRNVYQDGEGSVKSISFNRDGTKMFVSGDGTNTLLQYSLSTPFSLDSATYLGNDQRYNPPEFGNLSGHTFSEDGKKLYFFYYNPSFIGQYNLSISFDLNTAPTTGFTTSITLPAEENSNALYCVKFKPDGTKMFTIDYTDSVINEYTLTTPYEVNTAGFSTSASVLNNTSNPIDFSFSYDGTKVLVLDHDSGYVSYYTLNTAWDITSIKFQTNVITGVLTNDLWGSYWTADGKKFYLANDVANADEIVEYNIESDGIFNVTAESNFFDKVDFYDNIEVYGDTITRGDLSVTGTLTIGDNNPGANLSINGVSDLSTILRTNNIENAYKENNKRYSFEFNDNTARGVGFKTDGTRMYVSGQEGNDITEFQLSTPWEVGTASLTGVTYSLGYDPNSIKFKSDGSKLFVTNGTASDISEYNLSTPWDLTSITGLSTSFVFSQGSPSTPCGLDFTPDGSRMFLLDRTLDNVFEYSLSTPWSVNTAVGPSSSFYVGTQNSDPFGVAIDPSGVHMYIVGITENNIHQYEMSTAFDVRTATYTGKTLGTVETDTTGVFIKPDGSKIFITGYNSDLVRTFNLSSAFDVSSGSAGPTFSVGDEDPYGLWFKPDGTELYVSKNTGDKIDQYTLSSAWDVSTAGFTTTFFTGDENNVPTEVQLSPSGDKLFVADNRYRSIVQYPLSVAWDISSASTGIRTAYELGEEGQSRLSGFVIDNGGTRLYSLDHNTTNRIVQYEMSTAFDVRTISYNGDNLYLRGNGGLGYPWETESRGLTFDKYGTKLFTSGYTYDQILQFNLRVPYDLNTASFEKNIYSHTKAPSGLEIDSYNSRLYVLDNNADQIVQFDTKGNGGNDLDLDAIEFRDDSFYLDDENIIITKTFGDHTMVSVFFSPDGRNMYTTGHEFNAIYHYRLSTPWDIRTSKPEGKHDFSGFQSATVPIEQDKTIASTTPSQLYFREDGKFLAVVSINADRIYSFELETAWDLSSITIILGDFYIGAQDGSPECLWFSNDGVYMYSGGEISNKIFQYTLSTPWDITTASLTRSYDVNSFEALLVGISFSGDGRKLYFVGYTDAASPKIHEHTLQTPWDISSVTTTRSFGINAISGTYLRGLYVRRDMSEFFVLDYLADYIHRYKIPTETVEFTSTIEAHGDIDVYQDVNVSGKLNTQGAYIENYLGIGTDGYRNDATLVSEGPARIPSIGNRPRIKNLEFLNESFAYPVRPYIYQSPSMHLSPDGKNLYLGTDYSASNAETSIVQYKLKTPFKINTAEYYGHYTFFVEDGVAEVRGIHFSSDGNKVFASISGNNSSQIAERVLDIAWDIKSITNNNGPTLITAGFGNEDERTDITGLEFNSDGTKLYYIKTHNVNPADNKFAYIFEHTLSSAYDLSTVSAEPTFIYGDDRVDQTDIVGFVPITSYNLQFNDDGTKLFVNTYDGGGATSFLYQYNLTTPYDLSTLEYEAITYRNYHFINSYGFHVSSDGKKLYAVSFTAYNVYEFDLETPWDFNSYKYPENMSGILYPPSGATESIQFCDHGKKCYSFGGNELDFSVFNLKNPYDLTTLTDASHGWTSITLSAGGEFNDFYSFKVTEDGMNGYAAVYGNNSSGTAQYKFHTPFDFTTLYPVVIYKGQRNLSQDVGNAVIDSIVSPDGKKLYELDAASDRIYEHDIKVPFDLRTARRTEGRLWTGGDYNPQAIGFGTDGKTLYWVKGTDGTIQEAKTSDDEDLYDIRTMSWSGISTTSVNTTNTKDFAFNNDGSKFYTLEITTDSIHERTLTYNGNIRVSSGATSYSFASDGLTEPQAFQFKSDGSSLFVVDNGTDAVYQYALSTPFAVNTISGLTTSFGVSNQAVQPYSLKFKPDGTKMFVLNYTGNGTGDELTIYSYNLSAAWDVSTASYTGGSFKPRYKTYNNPTGIEFSPDGKRLLVSSSYFDSIYQFELSIPWDITTATYETTTLDVGPEGSVDTGTSARTIEMSPEGRTLILSCSGTAPGQSILFQYDLKTPWKINTASYTSEYVFNPNFTDARHFAIGNAYYDWDNGDVYFSYRANSNSNPQIIRTKLPEYKDDKFEVFGGLDVYGKTRFEGSIDVKEPSRFEYIGIGTDNESLRSQLTVNGNANLPSISPNEMDIENYYLESKDYFSVTSQHAPNRNSNSTGSNSNPYGIYFSPDGKYMYLSLDPGDSAIYQYELSIPWDPTTAKLEHGLWVSSTKALADINELSVRDVGFGSDGKYLYVVGEEQDTVFQWTLGTEYQINTAGFTTSFSVASQEAAPNWVGFSTGGDRMYILGNSDEINEYSLSTPWFVDSASFDSNTAIDDSRSENAGYIKPDGTKMWMIDAQSGQMVIHEFNFGTPWDSSTLTIARKDVAEYTGTVTLPVKTLDLKKYGINAPEGLYFSPDGYNMYVTDTTVDAVYRFHMETPWDFENAKIDLPYGYPYDDITLNGLEANAESLSFSGDGTRVYLVSPSTQRVYEFVLDTPWEANTIRYEGKYYELHSHGGNVATEGTNGLAFKPDGTKMFVLSGSGFYQYLNGYDLKTPWDILTATPADRFDLYSEGVNSEGIEFNNDGTKFYIALSTGFGIISEYECTVPWDLTTAHGAADKFTLLERNGLNNNNSFNNIPRGYDFKPDGSRLYVFGGQQDKLFQVDLEKYWNVKTGQQKYEVSIGYDAQCVRFKPDGLKVYLTDYPNSLVKEHTLTTAWDISTINTTPSDTFNTSGQSIQPVGIEFKPDGTKMWIAPYNTGNDNIYEYNLSSAWDISSASASYQFDPPDETKPSQIQFSDDGRKFYVIGDQLHVVQQFDVDVPWDISSIRPYASASYPDTTNFQSRLNGPLNAEGNPFFYVKRDGSLLFMSTQSNDQYGPIFSNSIVQYTLNELYDVRTAKLENRGHVFFNSALPSIRDISFNGDGSRLYVTTVTTYHRIYEIELAVPFKIDTATISGRFIETDNSDRPGQPGVGSPFHESTPSGIYVKKDGTRIYFTGNTATYRIWQVELPSKPLDLSGNVRVHGELNADYTIHTPELKASYVDADMHVSIGSTERPYGPNEVALTVHGKSDISKIHRQRESDFRNFTINTQWLSSVADGTPTDIYFKPGGTTLYVNGSAGEDIDEYLLDAPYDLRNGKFVRGVSINEFGVVDSRGLQFKPDGTKLFVSDVNTDDIFELSLSTPWDITTVGLTTVYVTSEDSAISGMHIGAGGTAMYLTGYNPNDDIFQYSLSTAWDLTSTVGLTTIKSLNEDGISNSEGIYVVPDGTRLFITDTVGEEIAQYEMSTPFDVSTAGLTTTFHSGLMNPFGIEFINDGMEYVMTSNGVIGIAKYSCEEPYNINTTNGPLCSGRLLVESAVNGSVTEPRSVNLKPDGTKLYVGNYSTTNPDLYEYDLRIPWDVGSAKLNQSLSLPTTKSFSEWRFKEDGTKMYGLDYDDSANSAIEEYELSKPWDISTAGLTTTFVIGNYETQPLSLNILPDGSRFYISGTQRDAFFGWEMTRPWDLRSVRRIAKDFDVGAGGPQDIAWGDFGRKLYILGNVGDDVTQYTLTGGGYGYEYDLRYVDESTATTFSVASQDNTPKGFHFKSDGTQMWIVGDQNDKIYKYTLSTAWDISTASLSQTMSGTTQTTPYDMELSDDGEYAYVYGGDYQIDQYKLTTPYDLSTIGNVISESYYMPGAIVSSTQLAFEFGKDGTRLYVTGSGGYEENGLYRVHQFNLSEAWNVRTAKYLNSFRLYWGTHTQPTVPQGITFRPDGKQFTVVCNVQDYATSYDLETPWELDSAHYDGDWRSFDTNNDAASSPENNPWASTFNSDGTEFYIIGDSHYITKWDLRVPYDFTSASTDPSDFYRDNYSKFNFNTLYRLNTIIGMYLSPDDERLYITTVITGSDAVWEFKIPREKTELLGKTEVKSLTAHGANIDALQTNGLVSTGGIDLSGDLIVGDSSAEYETTIQFETPTSNKIVTIPDKSGFVGIVPGGSYHIMYNDGSRLSAGSSFTYNPNYGSVVLTGGNITTTTPYQVLNLSQTWNNASGIYTGIQLNITDTNSSASSKLVDLQVDTTTVVDVFKDGAVTLNSGYTVSGLPSGTVGQIARVTDANSPTVGATVASGGSANALCWYNGANWTVIGV